MKQILFLLLFVATTISTFAQSHTNSKNPYDYVGKQHNDFLAYYAANVAADASKATKLSLVPSTMKNYGVSAGIIDSKFDVNAFLSTGTISKVLTNPNFSMVAEFNSLRMTVEAGYQQRLEDVVNNLTTPEEIYTAVKSIETSILADQRLTQSGKVSLLCATATARYSCFYWSSQKSGNIWGVNSVSPHRQKTNAFRSSSAVPRWVKILLKDLVGAAGGAISGGGVVGAAVGAGIASANEAISQLP
ncbi:MAG: hypothetical protein RIR11_2033 [Bacteroidota bacterium]|jgi:hypothetical protein